jgi:hypothetical protein
MHVTVSAVTPMTMISMRMRVRVSMGMPMFMTIIHGLVLAVAVMRI